MPYNGFPLFGDFDHFGVTDANPSNDDEYMPDPRSAIRAWTVAALIVGALFVGLILIVPATERKPVDLERQLPSGYSSVVSALVRASGNDCMRVCSIARGYSNAASGSLIVACSRPDEADSCANPTQYEIRIAGPTVPTR